MASNEFSIKLIHPLEALTHLDGRNEHKITPLREFFSELAWMKYRLRVMVSYLQFLVSEKIINNVVLDSATMEIMTRIWKEFDIKDGERVWEIEKTTNHDLRALEIYLKEKLKKEKLGELSVCVNLGVGSEDINNVALRLGVKDAWTKGLFPQIIQFLAALLVFTEPVIETPMLARTHGQPASVTTLGKELAIFIDRIQKTLEGLTTLQFHAKFSGEVGNYNALKALLPTINWQEMEKKFLQGFGLIPTISTQIAPYDDLIQFFDDLNRLNTILIGFCRDVWLYAGFGYFTIANISGEVGSSGMPHKVNPIYFEGAEGGFEMANGILEFFSRKLGQNRLQRDFSDSTVRRNICLPFVYSYLSYQSLVTGLSRLSLNKETIENDLEKHWEVLSETLHTALKLENQIDAYTKVRDLLRGKVITQKEWQQVVANIPLSEERKRVLDKLHPHDLVGRSTEIAETILRNAKTFIKTILPVGGRFA